MSIEKPTVTTKAQMDPSLVIYALDTWENGATSNVDPCNLLILYLPGTGRVLRGFGYNIQTVSLIPRIKFLEMRQTKQFKSLSTNSITSTDISYVGN